MPNANIGNMPCDGNNLWYIVAILCLLTTVLIVGGTVLSRGTASLPHNGVAANGPLRVEGAKLLNAAGKPVQLRGMSSNGLAWFPEYANVRAMTSLRRRGANLFRAAMYADSKDSGYNQNPLFQRLNTALLRAAVENALAADMYVIIDWHLLMDKTPLPTMKAAVAFFDNLSALYAHEPGVIYEICNEPNGDTTWEDIRVYADAVIPAIRKHAPQALILVGSPAFSTDLSGALNNPLPYPNILYTYHFYTGRDDATYQTVLTAMQAAGLPVFVSEWGIDSNKQTGKLHLAEADVFLTFLHRRGISWVNWSLCNTPENFSAIRSDVRKLSDWTDQDLTPSGQLVFKALRE